MLYNKDTYLKIPLIKLERKSAPSLDIISSFSKGTNNQERVISSKYY